MQVCAQREPHGTVILKGDNQILLNKGVTKKVTCLPGLGAAQPYKAAWPKLISALSMIVYEQSHKAEINNLKLPNNYFYWHQYKELIFGHVASLVDDRRQSQINFGRAASYGHTGGRPQRHVIVLDKPFIKTIFFSKNWK